MVTAKQILAVTDEIARKFKPQRIIVFGSYAYGEPSEDSDVDVMLVMGFRGSPIQKACIIREAVDAPFRLEVHLRRENEIAPRIAWGDFFLEEVMQKGIVVHESGDSRVGAKGRRRLQLRIASLSLPAAAA